MYVNIFALFRDDLIIITTCLTFLDICIINFSKFIVFSYKGHMSDPFKIQPPLISDFAKELDNKYYAISNASTISNVADIIATLPHIDSRSAGTLSPELNTDTHLNTSIPDTEQKNTSNVLSTVCTVLLILALITLFVLACYAIYIKYIKPPIDTSHDIVDPEGHV
jgi:hypothetical protein